MQEHDGVLFRNSLAKCKQAFDDASYGIKDQRKQLVLNRLYYAIFYAVLALGYKNGFVTSKHAQLMGWFNRKYIYQENVFSDKLGKIYKNAFINRQESDYDLLTASEMTMDQINVHYSDCEFFLKKVHEFLKEPF